jgi:DNA-binding response OmpR family regulator
MSNPIDATRILVVEDDDALALALRARLVHEGYEVYITKDTISALAVARGSKPEVALLDVNLPAGSGFDVARR